MKVLIVGDTHSDSAFVESVTALARHEDVPTIVQLGDFGFSFDDAMMVAICVWLDEDEQRQFVWLDGNHDHHDYIDTLLENQDTDHPVPCSDFHERILYAPRGSTMMLGDKKCLFLGGAFSIDKEWRKPHVSWWPQELIRHKDVDNAIRNGQDIDVMFTHDAPDNPGLSPLLERYAYKIDDASRANRKQLAGVVDHVRPKVLFHGHYHHRYTGPYHRHDGGTTWVEGLSANYVHDEYFPVAEVDENVMIKWFGTGS